MTVFCVYLTACVLSTLFLEEEFRFIANNLIPYFWIENQSFNSIIEVDVMQNNLKGYSKQFYKFYSVY